MGFEIEVQRQDFEVYALEINGKSFNYNSNETLIQMDEDGDLTVKLSLDADDLLDDSEMETQIIDELKRNGYTVIDSDGDEV